MIRLTPTTIALTMDEVKDFEVRRRYRNYLSQQGKCPKAVEQAHERGGKAVTERVPSASSVTAGPSKLNTSPAPEHRSPLTQSPIQPTAGPTLEELFAVDTGLETFGAGEGLDPVTVPSTPTRALAMPPRRPPRTNSSPPDIYTTDGFTDPRRPIRSSPAAVLFPEIGLELGISVQDSGNDVREHNRGVGQTSTQSPQRQIEEAPRRFRGRGSPGTPNREHEDVGSEVQGNQSQRMKSTPEPEQSTSASRPSRRILTRSATKLIEARTRLLADETGGTASTSPDHGVLRRNRHHAAMLSSSPAQSSSAAQSSSIGQSSSTPHRATAQEPDASGFQIYDDSQPASSQPQTPQNLPEARHRSRILPAYTAPASSTASRSNRHARRRAMFARSRSPEGLETPGFRGLFGGTENRDEATLFEEALQRITELRGEGSPRTEQQD